MPPVLHCCFVGAIKPVVARWASFLPLRPGTVQKKRYWVSFYMRRVFIVDDCDDLMPEWLYSVSGAVDSDVLPLGIPGENLQQERTLEVMKKNLSKNCLVMFAQIAERIDAHKRYYQQFGTYIKLGEGDASSGRVKLGDLLRYQTSVSNHGFLNLTEFVGYMREGQNDIYFMSGECRWPQAPVLLRRNLGCQRRLDRSHRAQDVARRLAGREAENDVQTRPIL